jgi:hypothetical protein
MVFICALVSFMANLIDARTIRNCVILQPVTMPPAKDVLDAIEVLRGMNSSNARKGICGRAGRFHQAALASSGGSRLDCYERSSTSDVGKAVLQEAPQKSMTVPPSRLHCASI